MARWNKKHVTSANDMKAVDLAAYNFVHGLLSGKFPILEQWWKQYTEIYVVTSISAIPYLSDSSLKIENILRLRDFQAFWSDFSAWMTNTISVKHKMAISETPKLWSTDH